MKTGKTTSATEKEARKSGRKDIFIIIMIVYLSSIGYLIKLVMNKKISHVSFVTSLTLLMVFREKIVGLLEQIPIITGYFGRMENALKNLKHISNIFIRITANMLFWRFCTFLYLFGE